MAAEILGKQDELLKQLDKSLTNFKKTPRDRWSKAYVQVKLKLLDEKWTQFVDNHMTLVNEEGIEEDEYVKEDYYSKGEELYTVAKCEMLEKLEKLGTLEYSTPNTSPATQISHHATPDLKLPSISLPKFTGNYQDWLPFHDMFSSLIHNNLSLTNVQKLHYLKSSLSGEAEAILRHIPVTDVNYDDAWTTLKRRYSNKRVLANSIMKRLTAQKTISNVGSHAIKSLLDTTNECLNLLKNMGIAAFEWDTLLVHLTVEKLDAESVKLWEQHVSLNGNYGEELPTYKQLCVFLESRFRTLEVLESSKYLPKYNARQSSFHTNFNSNCRFCSGSHCIDTCKDFSQLVYSDRKSFIEKNGLCFNCLIPFHLAIRCRKRPLCQLCGRKHHSLMHPVEDSEKENPEDVSENDREQDERNENEGKHENVSSHYTDREHTKYTNVLLATALVMVRSKRGELVQLRALIDQGSQGSFITESAVQALGLQKYPFNCTVNGLGEGGSLASKSTVIFNAFSRYNKHFCTPVKAYVLKSLTRMLPTCKLKCDEKWSHLHQLELADPKYKEPGKIDLLLGADVYSDIIREGLKKGPRGSPIAQNTELGWILSGKIISEDSAQNCTITLSMHASIEEMDLLQKFWEIESDNMHKSVLSEEETRCEQHFAKTFSRDKDGRYIVSLPFKTENPSCQFGSSREIAERRLFQLETRLNKNKKLKEEYTKVINEYVELGHMEEIKDPIDKKKPTAVYLPHHAVVKYDRLTTKVRVVFDASCKYKNNVSLNDDLMVGPKLQQDLRQIIMRWRQHKVCLVADVVKMYRQIKVKESDYHRILWRDDPLTEQIRHFRITRVTFGTASAPYLSTKVLQQLAIDESQLYPVASYVTLTDFYVDDLLTGGDSYEDGIKIYTQMTKLFELGGFQLQKWNSNDTKLLQYMHVEENGTLEKDLNLDMTIKTLGIAWNNLKDQFQYSIKLPENESLITKRSIASEVCKLFDPMGWLAPTIIIGKVFLQRLWLAGITWDQQVPSEIKNDWLKFRSELPYLSEINIERWLHTTSDNSSNLEIHGFADASNIAYAAVVYSRIIDNEGIVHIQLVSAKTKVAPVKTVSIPRLELCGAVLLTRLINEIAEQLKVAKKNIFAYTDSKVVLSWLQGHPSKWKTFIANRTSEIITTLPSRYWYHVPSKENPADIASRGVQASQLKHETLWWSGPAWLKNNEINHTIPIDLVVDSNKLEEKCMFSALSTMNVDNFTQIFTRYSTLEKLLRVIARCRRFLYINKKSFPDYLMAEEIDIALFNCIKLVQKEEFRDEIECIKSKQTLKLKSKLCSLNPYLDERDILRVGGRLRHANIPDDAKHQILLPNNNFFSKLVIAQAHKKTFHGGPMLMLNYLRQRFWIIGATAMIKKEVHRCIVCVRHRAATRSQLMADLPKQRVLPTRPFLNTGVDFAGPIDLKMSKGRGCKTYKGYICIFICMVTRAIHIEIVTSLEGESFVAAFKRFTARRGHCSDMWSDNATNFIAGSKLLKDLHMGQMKTVKTEILDQLARDGTTWHNIPAAAPHFGGLWEAGVRSIKHHLKRTLGNSTLSYEEMSTVTSQIEACLNSRPISQISDNVNDLLPLTPGHFLIGEPPIIVPEKSYLDTNINRLDRWQLTQRMIQHFWDRWSKEYLNRLQQRPKWFQKTNNDIQIGMLVLVKDDNLPPGKWSLARILDVHPGNDGFIRVVTLKFKNIVTKRPITKICLLPVDST